MDGQTVTQLTLAATDEWVTRRKGVCAAECDNTEGKENRQNECRGNETDR